MIQSSINSDIFHLLCRRWIGVRELLYYTHRIELVHFGKVGGYHRSITIIISMMVLVNYIIVGWSIGGFTKIKLTGTSPYEFTNGNIMKVKLLEVLWGDSLSTKMAALGASESLSKLPFSS